MLFKNSLIALSPRTLSQVKLPESVLLKTFHLH